MNVLEVQAKNTKFHVTHDGVQNSTALEGTVGKVVLRHRKIDDE